MYGSNARKAGGLGGLNVRRGPMIGNMTDNEPSEFDDESFEPDMQSVGDFIGKLLMASPIIHMLHLQTDSFAKHLALGELYSELPGLVDAVAEEFQGVHGVIPSYNTYIDYNANPVIFVEGIFKHLKKYRGEMGPCSSMQSQIDVIESAIKSCLYKLKTLK